MQFALTDRGLTLKFLSADDFLNSDFRHGHTENEISNTNSPRRPRSVLVQARPEITRRIITRRITVRPAAVSDLYIRLLFFCCTTLTTRVSVILVYSRDILQCEKRKAISHKS